MHALHHKSCCYYYQYDTHAQTMFVHVYHTDNNIMFKHNIQYNYYILDMIHMHKQQDL